MSSEGDLGAGLHRETLAAARAQAALLCTLLPGAHMPLSAALLQVILSFSAPFRHLAQGRLIQTDRNFPDPYLLHIIFPHPPFVPLNWWRLMSSLVSKLFGRACALRINSGLVCWLGLTHLLYECHALPASLPPVPRRSPHANPLCHYPCSRHAVEGWSKMDGGHWAQGRMGVWLEAGLGVGAANLLPSVRCGMEAALLAAAAAACRVPLAALLDGNVVLRDTSGAPATSHSHSHHHWHLHSGSAGCL